MTARSGYVAWPMATAVASLLLCALLEPALCSGPAYEASRSSLLSWLQASWQRSTPARAPVLAEDPVERTERSLQSNQPYLLPVTQIAPVCVTPGNTTTLLLSTANMRAKTWRGWGTALAWWANYAGGLPDDQLTKLLDLLFSKRKGLGLNVVRFNIGGGLSRSRSPGFAASGFNSWRAMPGYKPTADGQYNWTADANQRKVLLGAKARGANTFIAFSKSPPWHMTVSGDVSGGIRGASNLAATKYQAFADYLADVVKQYATEWGVNFTAVSPFNQPAGFYRNGGGMEGCGFTVAEAARLVPLVAAALQNRSLATTVSWQEEWPKSLLTNTLALPAAVRANIGLMSCQGYEESYPSNQVESAARAFAAVGNVSTVFGKEVWMTEWGPGSVQQGSDIGVALVMARNIITTVNLLRARAWIYWQPLDAAAQWRLIDAPLQLSTSFTPVLTKKYHVLRHFARFVPRGSKAINASISGNSCPYCIASFYSPCTNRLVLFIVNQGSVDQTIKTSVAGFRNAIGTQSVTFTVFRTSATEDVRKVGNPRPTRSGGTAITAKARSLTSLVIGNVAPRSAGQARCTTS